MTTNLSVKLYADLLQKLHNEHVEELKMTNNEHFYMGDEGDWKVLWPKNVFRPEDKLTPLEKKQRQSFRDRNLQNLTPTPTQSARDIQVGGQHYKDKAMQPWDIIDAWGLDFYAGSVLKYLLRAKYKNGVEDLKKARHFLDKMIEDENAS